MTTKQLRKATYRIRWQVINVLSATEKLVDMIDEFEVDIEDEDIEKD